MKLYFILIFVIICVIQNTFAKKIGHDNFQVLQQKWKEQTNATEDDLDVLNKVEWHANGRAQFCLFALYYKEAGYMNQSNEVIAKELITDIKAIKMKNKDLETKTITIYNECGSTHKSDKDECKSFENFAKCLSEQAKKIGVNGDDLEKL